jgi:TatD DNase family protein
VIDTHCHLTFPDFQPPRTPGGVKAVLEEAAKAGVTGAITISTTTMDCLEALAIATAMPNVWCSSGIHPLHSDKGPHIWANLRRVAEHPKCVAWGELGLDNHYADPPRMVQDAVLAEQLAFIEARTKEGLVKPVVVHCREAFDDLIPILRRSSLNPSWYVFHCFTGSPDDIRRVLDFGAWVSFTGVVTYRNADEVREAARLVPADRIMVETDAPFLSPDPHRGERPCKPWMVSVTARRLAEVRGVAWEDFRRQINENARRFFGVG